MSALAKLLTHGLLSASTRIDQELPEILSSWDAGEAVKLEAIRDAGFRETMEEIAANLPLDYDPQHGWYMRRSCKSISGSVLGHLLDSDSICQPSQLSSAQTVAVRAAPYLQELLAEYPGLMDELPVIMTSMLDGNAILLADLENPDLRDALRKLLLKMVMCLFAAP